MRSGRKAGIVKTPGALPIVTAMLMVTLALLSGLGCKSGREQQGASGTTIVFKHGKIAGDPKPFRDLLDRFEREHPGIAVKDE